MNESAITIRRIEVSDGPGITELYRDEQVAAELLQIPYPSVKHWTERIEKYGPDTIALVALAGEEIVGHVGLNIAPQQRRRHVGTLGIAVKRSHQGRGVGSAMLGEVIKLADNWLNLKRIELTVYSDNQKAIDLYLRHGFVHEGEAKCYAFRNGQMVDAHYMARLRS